MIALRDAKLTDALPHIIAKEPWVQAMAHAVNRQMRKVLDYSAGVLISASMDTVPVAVLDVLAVELRLPYYDQTYSTEVKRELIKGALSYWAHTGTVESLAKIMTDIFGDAQIEEWYEYGSTHGYFRILTENANITGDTLEQFKQTAQNVKRMSAWLEEVLVDMPIPNMSVYGGFTMYDHSEITFTQEG